MRALRILVAHNVRCDRRGGMSRIMRLIHDPATRAGDEVEYLCAEHAPASARGRLGRLGFPLLVWRRAREAARAGRPYDVVNVHEPSAALVASLRAQLGGCAVTVTSHGVERRAWELAQEERRLHRSAPGWKTRVVYPLTSLWQSDLGLRRADQIFCLSFEDRDYLTRRYRIPPERIARLYPGADPVFAAAAVARDYARATRLLFAGTWRKNKGIEDFVPAFTTLARSRPELMLTVAGAGVSEDLVRRAFPSELRWRISCAETSTDPETAAVYAGTDLYVLPSLFEGTPLTLLEAMMSGLPIVTTNTCGMKDVIEHDRTGLLVPIRSPDSIVAAVERLLDRPDDRARLGGAARVLAAERYTWERVAEPVRLAYERLCGVGS